MNTYIAQFAATELLRGEGVASSRREAPVALPLCWLSIVSQEMLVPYHQRGVWHWEREETRFSTGAKSLPSPGHQTPQRISRLAHV